MKKIKTNTKINTLYSELYETLGTVFEISFSLSNMLFLSLPFSVFSDAMLASSLAHYLKSGKDPVIFSSHSQCLTGCLRWWGRVEGWEKREQAERERGRDGEVEVGWGLGWWRKPDAELRRKPDKEMKEKRP